MNTDLLDDELDYKGSEVILLPALSTALGMNNVPTNIIHAKVTKEGITYESVRFSKDKMANGYGWVTQYMYILSKDKIVDGDWFLNTDGLWQCTNGIIPKGLNPRKIIATTNDNLTVKRQGVCACFAESFAGCCPKNTRLPRPSDAFISAYCESLKLTIRKELTNQ